MSLRVILCYLVILVLIIFSWRRSWFVGACGAVILMGLVEHPEMPRTVFGIPGLSPWNVLIANVALAWRHQRRWEENDWDMPRGMSVLLALFIGVIFVSFLRALVDQTPYSLPVVSLLNDALINSLKFLLPFYLFYDGCRSPQRAKAALVSVLLLYLLLGSLVVKHMGLHGVSVGEDLNERGARLVHAATGFHRVDMAMMLAGASWGMLAFTNLVNGKLLKLAVIGAFMVLTFGEALTGGRTGYATWGLIGFLLCLFRWRALLLVAPVALMIALGFMPAVTKRLSMGFGGKSGNIIVHNDESQITSGRTQIWPYALDGISKSPLIGYGRFAFPRLGLMEKVTEDTGEGGIAHPHCAYLEMLLDNGVIGFLLVMPLYGMLVFYSWRLFLDRSDPLNSAIGALSLSLFLALLIASIGAQTFYPREGVGGMWAAAGLMLRRVVDLRRAGELKEEEDEPADDIDETRDPSSLESNQETMAEAKFNSPNSLFTNQRP